MSKIGTIVLLNGTSSAGKTSIMKALQNIYGDSYSYLNGDEFADTYAVAHSMPDSMPRDEQNKQILSALFAHAKQLAISGKNVFVDVVEFDDYYDHYCSILDCKKLVKILVYCPLDVIVDRVALRNISGQEKEKRPLNLSFGQFAAIYKLQKSADEVVVDRIATSRMRYALEAAAEEVRMLMKEAGVKAEEFEANIALFKQPLVEQFNFDGNDEIVLTTRHPWDLIVNSGIKSPAEIAHIIVGYLKYPNSII